jgi:hypothetical protein
VLDGLRRFYRDFGFAPTATAEYQKSQQFTGASITGVGNPYPSSYGVLKYFGTFREAWTAAGIVVDRAWEAWAPEEDWFLTEGAGVFSRKELAEALNRSANAVHRRLYDLGVHSYKARGWTLHRVMRATQIPDHVVRKYADRGELPYFRGSKCISNRRHHISKPASSATSVTATCANESRITIRPSKSFSSLRQRRSNPKPVTALRGLKRDGEKQIRPRGTHSGRPRSNF